MFVCGVDRCCELARRRACCIYRMPYASRYHSDPDLTQLACFCAYHRGWCRRRNKECQKLGVADNLCGKCTRLPGGGFRLEETKYGLRYAGASFDDNQIGRGSYQAMNICSLARYGNGGKIVYQPSTKCVGVSKRGRSHQVPPRPQ